MPFIETDHPRGQAANAGQFASKTNAAPTDQLDEAGSDTEIRIATTVTPAMRREIVEKLAALRAAERMVKEFAAPSLGVVYGEDAAEYDDPADAGYEFVCPWCGSRGVTLISVDSAERDTEMETIDEPGVVSFDYDSGADFGGSHYATACCRELPVSLPADWEEV